MDPLPQMVPPKLIPEKAVIISGNELLSETRTVQLDGFPSVTGGPFEKVTCDTRHKTLSGEIHPRYNSEGAITGYNMRVDRIGYLYTARSEPVFNTLLWNTDGDFRDQQYEKGYAFEIPVTKHEEKWVVDTTHANALTAQRTLRAIDLIDPEGNIKPYVEEKSIPSGTINIPGQSADIPPESLTHASFRGPMTAARMAAFSGNNTDVRGSHPLDRARCKINAYEDSLQENKWLGNQTVIDVTLHYQPKSEDEFFTPGYTKLVGVPVAKDKLVIHSVVVEHYNGAQTIKKTVPFSANISLDKDGAPCIDTETLRMLDTTARAVKEKMMRDASQQKTEPGIRVDNTPVDRADTGALGASLPSALAMGKAVTAFKRG